MASLCSRLILRNSRRAFSCTSGRYAKELLPDPLEHATGLEKKELLAHLAGNDDPFMMKSVRRERASSKDDPIMVPSAFDSRIVGCVCEEEQTYICWMWVHAGNPRRCECGHWFKLEKKTPIGA